MKRIDSPARSNAVGWHPLAVHDAPDALCDLSHRTDRLINRKQVSKVKGGREQRPCPYRASGWSDNENVDEQIPNPRRPDGARGLRAGAARRARHRRSAAELPRRAGRLAGGAARVRALPLRAAARQADAGDARADRARGRRALPLRAGDRDALAGRARGGPGARRGRAGAPVQLQATRARRRCCATCRRCSRTAAARRCTSTRRRARPAGTTSRSSRRSPRWRSRCFTAMVNVAGEVPVDGSSRGVAAACRQRKISSWLMCAREHPLNAPATTHAASGCCPLYHEAVELVGRRWTGAILRVLMDGPLRFSEIAQAVPELSDRLLSERMKELEARGDRRAHGDPGAAAARRVPPLPDGPRARAGAVRAPALGEPLARAACRSAFEGRQGPTRLPRPRIRSFAAGRVGQASVRQVTFRAR